MVFRLHTVNQEFGTARSLTDLFFLKRFIRQTVYTRCTRMNYKIVPVTNSNRNVEYEASGKRVVEIQM